MFVIQCSNVFKVSWLESNINLPADSELSSISNNDALLETYDFIVDSPDTWILDFETFENNQHPEVLKSANL